MSSSQSGLGHFIFSRSVIILGILLLLLHCGLRFYGIAYCLVMYGCYSQYNNIHYYARIHVWMRRSANLKRNRFQFQPRIRVFVSFPSTAAQLNSSHVSLRFIIRNLFVTNIVPSFKETLYRSTVYSAQTTVNFYAVFTRRMETLC